MSNWMQESLLPPAAIEIRISVGFVPERDHGQVQVEAFDPASRAVIAMWSRHHFSIMNYPAALAEAVEQAEEMIQATVDPF